MVVHIYPEDCPMCGISNADPVIISRSMALLIVSTYCRVQCGCGWKLCNEKTNDGWETPETQSEDDDDIFEKNIAIANENLQNTTTEAPTLRYERKIHFIKSPA